MDITSYLLGKQAGGGGGGTDLSEYFNTTIDSNTSSTSRANVTKKIPDIYISDSVTSLSHAFTDFGFFSTSLPKLIGGVNVTSLSAAFNMNNVNVSKVLTIDVSGLITTKVTNMGYMFANQNALTTINGIENLNTNAVTTMVQMFNGCSSLTELNVSNFNTSNVTIMQNMFYDCKLLTELNVSNFNTSNVTSMSAMFQGCSSLTSLDLSNFDFGKLVSISNMFTFCSNLQQINFGNSNSGLIYSISNMFNGCKELTNINLSNFYLSTTHNNISTRNMFNGCTKLTTIDIRNFDFTKVTDFNDMFGASASNGVPNDCLIIVKDDTAKTWITSKFSRLTNVKTVAEL